MQTSHLAKLIGATSVLSLAALGASPALAQTAEAPEQYGVLDIIVTAQKREQRLQEVPVSIVAISGEQIEKMNITDLRSIQGQIPNFTVLNSGVNPVVFMRGFGSGPNNVAFDQTVSIYMDGIYGGRGAQFSAPFFDLARMEVLRGPQGALFGRNTAAGAISLVTAGPGNEFEAHVSAGYDFERNGFDVSGVASGPVSDTLGVRVAGKITRQDGYIRNLYNDKDDPQLSNELARLTVKWTPADYVDVTAKLEYARHLLEGGVNVSGSLTQQTNFAEAGKFRYVSSNYAGSDLDEESGITTWNAALTANFDVGDHVITAIGGYSAFDTVRFTNYDERSPDGTVPPNNANAKFGNGFPEDFKQWSGELRLTSPTGGLLEYVVGAYYDHSDYHLQQDSFYRDIAGFITGHQQTNFNQSGNAFSLYGQGTLNFTPDLRLIGGLRYSHVSKNGTFSARNVSGIPLNTIGPDRSGSLSESYFDPSFTLQADIAEGVMVYATYARGSKSGGFVSNTYNVSQEGFSYKPERSTNYEAGIKSTLGGGVATINLTLFRTEFEDLQQSAYDPDLRTFLTRNAAEARSQGLEMEIQVAPTRNLQFHASFAYLDAKFVDYPGAPCLATQTLAECNSAIPESIAANNLAGMPLQFAPKFSGNVGLSYTLDIGDYNVQSSASTSFRSDYFIADGYSPIWGLQDGWAKVDARIQFGPNSDRWNIALIGRNLGNEKTRGAAIRFPVAITGVTRSLNWMDEYRSVMLQGTVRF